MRFVKKRKTSKMKIIERKQKKIRKKGRERNKQRKKQTNKQTNKKRQKKDENYLETIRKYPPPPACRTLCFSIQYVREYISLTFN
jgi:hypothetical protein